MMYELALPCLPACQLIILLGIERLQGNGKKAGRPATRHAATSRSGQQLCASIGPGRRV